MLLKISHDAADSEFDWKDQYRLPIIMIRGISHEAVITKLSDFDALSKNVKDVQAIRADIETALYNSEAVRLLPVK